MLDLFAKIIPLFKLFFSQIDLPKLNSPKNKVPNMLLLALVGMFLLNLFTLEQLSRQTHYKYEALKHSEELKSQLEQCDAVLLEDYPALGEYNGYQ